MSSLLSPQRSSEKARQTQHGATSASHAVRSVVLADQFTFDAKHSGRQGEKADVLAGELFCHLSEFLPRVFLWRVNVENYMGALRSRSDRAGSGLWISAASQTLTYESQPGRSRVIFLCVPLCPLWFQHLHFINHKGHKGTRRKDVTGVHTPASALTLA